VPLAWRKHEVERLVCHARTLEGNLGEIPRRLWWPSLIIAEYWTGCRIWALLQTATADLSMTEGFLIVRAQYQKTNRDQFFSLPDQAIAAIAAHWCPHRVRVWPWPHCRRHFWRCFRGVVEGAGLSSSHRGMDLFHKLRRTCLSYAAAVDVGIAQRQAGHSNPKITLERYIDPSIAPQQSAANVLPALNL
jgi:integrase